MSLQIQVNPVSLVHEAEKSFDSMFAQVLDCLKRESDSILQLLVLFESMKQQVMELAEERASGIHESPSRFYPYKQELKELEDELLEAEDIVGEARSTLLLLLCMAYYRVGSLWQAKNMALLARGEYNQWEMEHKAGFADLLLAVCCMELEQFEQAGDHCVLAINETSLADDALGAAQIWQVYARILDRQGRTEESVAALLMANEIFRKQGAVARQVKLILTLSLVLVRQQDSHGAIFHLKQALSVCRQHRLQLLELEVLHMLAHLFLKTGRMVETEGCKQRIHQILGEAR